MTTIPENYVGIDVSKDRLDVAVLGEQAVTQVDNTRKGITVLVAQMKHLDPVLIVVEATGGYEEQIVLGLYEVGLPVALVNPQRVRQYARARGILAKTDGIDAHNLADFGKKTSVCSTRSS